MESDISNKRKTESSESSRGQNLSEVLEEIEVIKEKIEQLNSKMNNTI